MIIYSCITGGYDKPFAAPDLPGFEFIMFTDNPDLKAENWKIVPIAEDKKVFIYGMYDPVRTNRYVKIFPWAHDDIFKDITGPFMYIDGNFDIKGLSRFLAYVEYDPNYGNIDLVCMRHYQRICAYSEAKQCIDLGKDTKEMIQAQVAAYRAAGFSENAGLWELSVIIRQNTPYVQEFCYLWFEHVLHYSSRDQISFPFVHLLKKPLRIKALDRKTVFSYLPKYSHNS
jgi:hypothetical protein